MLELGGPAKVIGKLRAFARGRRAKMMNKEIAYLVGHLEAGRLRYFELREAKVPIGSGVVESAVRRVINLRFKQREPVLVRGPTREPDVPPRDPHERALG